MGKSDGVVERIVLLAGDGELGKRVNIVLVAEGYRAEDAAQFETDAALVRNQILAAAPFSQHASRLNVLRLDVWSTDAGADRGGVAVATYFDAAFATYPPHLLLVDDELVVDAVASALTEGLSAAHAHKIIVLVNTPHHGGSGGVGSGIAVASRAFGVRTALHELGHLFGLVDEYDSYAPEPLMSPVSPEPLAISTTSVWPNLSLSSARAQLPWRDLVAPDTPLPTVGPAVKPTMVGAFPVEQSAGDAYRPQWRCCMRDDTDAFCKVCARHIAHLLETPPT